MDNGYMSSTMIPLLFLKNSLSLSDFYSSSLPHSNSSELKVESLELPELLKNPLVWQMYEYVQQAVSQVMKDNEKIKFLWKKNRNLSTELQSVCRDRKSVV